MQVSLDFRRPSHFSLSSWKMRWTKIRVFKVYCPYGFHTLLLGFATALAIDGILQVRIASIHPSPWLSSCPPWSSLTSNLHPGIRSRTRRPYSSTYGSLSMFVSLALSSWTRSGFNLMRFFLFFSIKIMIILSSQPTPIKLLRPRPLMIFARTYVSSSWPSRDRFFFDFLNSI